jgi:mannose-6-phosphate isomerase-like protein (cupin superfamily)
MLINEKDSNNIKKNRVTLVKNFIDLERNYDFNLISNLIEENDLSINQATNLGNLKDVFQIYKISNCLNEFKIFFDFLTKLFKYERDLKDEADLFFSFASQVGTSHVDKEDVFIIGLKGKTLYRIFNKKNKDYEINEGDLIFIPRGLKHKVLGVTPRIIVSIGFWGKRI